MLSQDHGPFREHLLFATSYEVDLRYANLFT